MTAENRPQIPAIVGVGQGLPQRRIDNAFMDRFLGKKPGFSDKLMGMSGARINNRYWVEKRKSAVSNLVVPAIDEALEMARLSRSDIAALWIATSSPDRLAVSTAAIIQEKMGLSNQVVGSTNQDACPGWIIAAQRAATSLDSRYGTAGYHAVVGAEVISPYLDPRDPRTAALFGDAAGATIFANVTPDEGAPTAMGFSSGLDGKYAKDLGIETGGSEVPQTSWTVRKRRHLLRMDGEVIGTQAQLRMPQVLTEALASAGDFPREEVDRFVFHQANRKIIEAAAEALNIPFDKCIFTVSEMGNTSAASIPTAIARGIQRGEIRRNNVIAVASFGAGLGYAAAVLPMVGLPEYPR